MKSPEKSRRAGAHLVNDGRAQNHQSTGRPQQADQILKIENQTNQRQLRRQREHIVTQLPHANGRRKRHDVVARDEDDGYGDDVDDEQRKHVRQLPKAVRRNDGVGANSDPDYQDPKHIPKQAG